MRRNISFRNPAKFVQSRDYGDRVLAASGAEWFAGLLRRVPGLLVDEKLCQEDWGVVFIARRNRKRFWIGLSARECEGAWLAHFHRGVHAWIQPFTSDGKTELRRLLVDVQDVLVNDSETTEIIWYEEGEMSKPAPTCFTTPLDD